MLFELSVGLDFDHRFGLQSRNSSNSQIYFDKHKHPIINIYDAWRNMFCEEASYSGAIKQRLNDKANSMCLDLLYPVPLIIVQSNAENCLRNLYENLKSIGINVSVWDLTIFVDGHATVELPQEFLLEDKLKNIKDILQNLPKSETLDYNQIIKFCEEK